ncbi:AMP-binding protein [Prauserella oleivorans]|uniref:AMP-binding protein n=1 Tax=Prauserella oleivorans TaxID=1478153 RepID=A0ABW5W924_9PSEU
MNLLSLLAGLTKRDPHAIIAIDADPAQPVHVSRSELWRRTLQLRADLATAGVGRGDGVALWLPNWSDVLVWHIATASLGAYAVGLGAATPAADVARVVEQVRPRVVAAAHDARGLDLAGRLREVVTGSEGLDVIPAVAVVAGPHGKPPIDPSPWDIGGGAWLPSATTAGMPMPRTTGDEPAVAFEPALGVHRESVLVAHATGTARALGVRENDLLLCTQPVTGPLGLGFALAAVAGEGTCLLDPALDETTLLGDLARFEATHLATDEQTATRLAETCHDHPCTLPALRWVGVANAATPDAAGRAEKELGVPASAFYAPGEVLAPAALWPSEHATPARWHSGGLPVEPGLEVRVVDPLSNTPMPAGEQGMLQLRGPGVPEQRLGKAGEPPVTGDGWFSTGDLAIRTTEGELRYLGPAHRPAG